MHPYFFVVCINAAGMSIDWSSEAADVRDGSCSIEEVVSVSEAPRMGVTQEWYLAFLRLDFSERC